VYVCESEPDAEQRRLEIVESDDAYLVTEADDPSDWLVSFEKADRFPARAWAENMVSIFNLGGRPVTAPGQRPSTYHPGDEPSHT
jgi:hypothetical protein